MTKLVQRSRYTPTKGVDLKSSDRNRTEDYLTGGQNMRYDENFNLAKRFGFQKIAYGTEVIGGIREFTTTDYKGITKTELIGFGRYPYRLVKAYSTITNSTGGIIYLDMRYVVASSKWYFTITSAAGAVLLSYDMTTKHVDDLVGAIEALANITCVTPVTPTTWVTKSASIPAEYSELMELEPLAHTGTRNLEWYFWERINTSTWGSAAVLNPSMFNTGSETITYDLHGLSNGDIVRFSVLDRTGAVALPDPLDETVDYYVVSATWNTFSVSTSLGGGPVNLADTGTGVFVLKLFGGQPIYHHTTDANFVIPSSVSILSRLFCSTAPTSYSQSNLYGNGSDSPLAGWEFNNDWYIPDNPFTTNQRHICKYDGQTWTRAHVPRISVGTGAAVSTYDVRGVKAEGTKVGSDRSYKFSAIAIDKTGNVTESSVSAVEASVPSGTHPAHFYWPNENKCLVGFNDHYATAHGAQTGVVAITVHAGHTFVAGDVAYFWDESQLKFISREVVSVAATTVTISPTPIQANDNGGVIQALDDMFMSPNTRLAIWRTKAGIAGDFYLVEEIPFVFGFVRVDANKVLWMDDKADADLGAVFIPEDTRRFWMPPGNILSSFNNIFCVSGVGDNRNTVFFSSADDIESIPLATSSFNIDSEVRALGQSGASLGVFSDTKANIVTGDLASFNFRVEKLSENIGCTSHASIQEVEEGVIFFQTEKGPYMLVNGRQLAPVGRHPSGASLLEPYFTANYATVNTLGGAASFPRFANAIGAANGKWSQYVLNIPWTTESYLSSGTFGLPSTLVYDYKNQSWCPFWTGVEAEFARGVCFFNDELFGLSSGATQTLYKQITKKGALNYADHAYPVWGYAETFWDAVKNPDLYKKYLWITLSGSENCNSSTWTTRVQTYLNYNTTADHSDFTMSFSVTGPPQEQKLKAAKANAIKFRFSNETMYEDFSIQGWMYEVAGEFKEQSSSWGNQGR